MNIGIDANCIIFDRSGFGRYARELIKNILKYDQKNHYFLYASFIRKPERRKILDDLVSQANSKNATVKIIPIPAAWKEFLTGFPISSKNFIRENLDLYFAPHYAGIPVKGFEHNIVSIQDLVFMKYPEHRGRRLSRYYLKRTKIALKNCEQIIASSGSTKKDLIELLDVPKEKIEVVHLGVDPDFSVSKNAVKSREIINQYVVRDKKYILSVSTLEPRKNLKTLIKAFSLLPHQFKRDYQIVLVGASGWNNRELKETIQDYNLQDKVTFTGFVPDEHLAQIYSGASVFVFASFYEGFGLPPLEAMAAGTPVICSNTSSLPEVVGRAAVLFDPADEEALARSLEKVLRTPKMVERLIRRGLTQAKKFSWKKTALQTVAIFNQQRKSETTRKSKKQHFGKITRS